MDRSNRTHRYARSAAPLAARARGVGCRDGDVQGLSKKHRGRRWAGDCPKHVTHRWRCNRGKREETLLGLEVTGALEPGRSKREARVCSSECLGDEAFQTENFYDVSRQKQLLDICSFSQARQRAARRRMKRRRENVKRLALERDFIRRVRTMTAYSGRELPRTP